MLTSADVNRIRQSVEDWASTQEPQGGITAVATATTKVVSGLLGWPMLIVHLLLTPVLAILGLLTFGLVPRLMHALNRGFNSVTVGTSRLWRDYPASRPLMLIPGSLFASFHSSYVPLLYHYGDWNRRAREIALPFVWPHSDYVFDIPKYRETGLEEWEVLKFRFARNELSADDLLLASYEISTSLEEHSPGSSDAMQGEVEQLVPDAGDRLLALFRGS